MGRRNLVIGGAGYIGSHFVKNAIDQGDRCLVFDNLSTGFERLIDSRADFQNSDILSIDSIREAIRKFRPDQIYHFAAFALVGESVAHPDKYFHNNVVGVANILDVIKEQTNKPDFIFSSSCAVFGPPESLPISEGDAKSPISPYGRSKLMAEYLIEDYARAYGGRAIALRYFNACGADPAGGIGECHDPETHLIPNIIAAVLKGEKLKIFGDDFKTKDGTCVRDYIHVCDLAEAHRLAADYIESKKAGSFDVFHLGTGQGYSNLEIIKAVEEVLGRSISYEMAERRPGDPAELVSATEKMRSGLGFQPKYSDLKTIVRTAYDWHKGQMESK